MEIDVNQIINNLSNQIANYAKEVAVLRAQIVMLQNELNSLKEEKENEEK